MINFCNLIYQLDETTKTNAKINALVNYFTTIDKKDAIWAIALLTGKRPKRAIKTSDLKLWAVELAQIPYWLFDDSYSVVGDLSETISLLISSSTQSSTKALHLIMLEITLVSKKNEEEKKEWLFNYWKNLSPNELFIFNKLIGGSFRIGVSQQLVYKALAKVYNLDDKIITHKLMGNWLPHTQSIDELLLQNSISSDYSKPYPFYLAYALDIKFEELKSISDWQIERKYDGIRGQLISRNNEIHIWSRGEELMTEKFIEFQELINKLPSGLVLDGEILPLKDGKILSFNEMQKRIGRKNISKKMLLDVPLCMMCYDVLEYNSEDIRTLPLFERRKILETIIKNFPNPLLHLSPLLIAENWKGVDELRNHSKKLGCEGVMLKNKNSNYETGRRRGNWWKWKVEPYTIDAVMIYAQAGHGRRANLFTDYTFAVWDNNELVPFAKAYSGLTDKEIIEVDAWVKKNTREKFGPVRSVNAELVFELAFEGINLSQRHKSGIALRFPRIARWRKDKKVGEINTKQDLLDMLNTSK
jgi:DNA ligase 1